MDRSVVATRYWLRTGDGRAQCDVCPRACRLRDGQRGFCFVRMGQGGAVVLTTYGRSSGYCVDPVEKKPLNHFLPGSPVLRHASARSVRRARRHVGPPAAAGAAGRARG